MASKEEALKTQHITAGRTPDGTEHTLCGIEVTWDYSEVDWTVPDCDRCTELDA